FVMRGCDRRREAPVEAADWTETGRSCHFRLMPEPNREPPLRVSLMALPQSTPTTLHAFFEVFGGVGTAWGDVTGLRIPARRMECQIVARSTEPYRSPVGPLIAPDVRLEDARPPDLVVVTDLALPAEGFAPGDWDAELDWVRQAAGSGAAIASICTGSVFLAEAGLLDGFEATTHWAAEAIFRARYPQVRLRPERILCLAGIDGNIVTGGGPGSWEDVALHLIGRHCGRAEAVRIAKVFVLGDRSQGQLVFSSMRRIPVHADAVVAESQRWIAENYALPHAVSRMTERSGLPARTFKRRFRSATGYAPIDYVHALRVEEAKQLLETTGLPTGEIAAEVGYEDQTFFRRLFRRLSGVTPSSYRRRFNSVGAP
ncbi:MAG: helix-turn-helix domain-containing protein, partial [Oricola sp.]